MDTKTLLVILIPSISSFIIAITSLIVGALREKQKKSDIIWNTVKEIVLKSNLEGHYPEKRDAEDVAIYFHYLYKYLTEVDNGSFEKHLKDSQEN